MKTVMLVLVTAFCATLNAATVDLISSGSGVFDYGLMLTSGESVTFGATDQITFSPGLRTLPERVQTVAWLPFSNRAEQRALVIASTTCSMPQK